MSSLLTDLDEQQVEAATSFGQPVVVRAGAGTGKTRAITHRIAYGVETGDYSPSRVLAITFTAKAAGELKQRLSGLGVTQASARTIHSAALSQLGYFWPGLTDSSAPNVLPSKASTLAEAAVAAKISLSTSAARDLAVEIEWRKVRMLSIEQYGQLIADGRRSIGFGPSLEQVLDLMLRYEQAKDGRRQIDFEDVLMLCAGMLADEPRVAAQVREQFRHFVVDEFQDISPLQYELIKLWLGQRRDICVVGDSSQTIYSFAGASRNFLEQFERDFPDAVEVQLQTNYRSTQQIVGVANQLMQRELGALHLNALREGKQPEYWVAQDEADQAQRVAADVQRKIQAGASPSSIAVLYRLNSQSAALEEAFASLGISVKLRGGVEFFDRAEIKQAMMALHAEGVAKATGSRALVQVVADVLASVGYTQDAPEGSGAMRERWENLSVLARLADDAPKGTTVAEFVTSLRMRAEAGHDPDERGVTLATIHAAKGLEWDSVYVVGATEGLLPMRGSDEVIEEERRLFYVAVTRARHELVVVHAGGRGSRAPAPSRFVQACGIDSSGA